MAKIYQRTETTLALNWWALALRGTVAVLFGLLTFMMPGITLAYLVVLFGIFALLDGVFNIVGAIRARAGEKRWWALLLIGIVGVIAGVLTFLYPDITALTLVYFIGAWAIWSGIFQIVAAVHLRKYITGEWLLALGGVLHVLFGVFLMLAPGAGALALLFWIAAFAVITGIVLIALAFRMRGWQRDSASGTGVLRPA